MSHSKTTRRSFLKTVGAGLLTLASSSPSVSSAETTKKPNIVLMMADDMGYSDIG